MRTFDIDLCTELEHSPALVHELDEREARPLLPHHNRWDVLDNMPGNRKFHAVRLQRPRVKVHIVHDVHTWQSLDIHPDPVFPLLVVSAGNIKFHGFYIPKSSDLTYSE